MSRTRRRYARLACTLSLSAAVLLVPAPAVWAQGAPVSAAELTDETPFQTALDQLIQASLTAASATDLADEIAGLRTAIDTWTADLIKVPQLPTTVPPLPLPVGAQPPATPLEATRGGL